MLIFHPYGERVYLCIATLYSVQKIHKVLLLIILIINLLINYFADFQANCSMAKR